MQTRYSVQELTAKGWVFLAGFESPEDACNFCNMRRSTCRVWDRHNNRECISF